MVNEGFRLAEILPGVNPSLARASAPINPPDQRHDSIAIEDGLKIAVLIPCHNQAATIDAVVGGFVEALPSAKIYVFDNNSTDDTARVATRAGARVYREAQDGKGNVIRRMFADVDADIYVLADGDGELRSGRRAVARQRAHHRACRHGGRYAARAPRQAPARPFGARAFEWLYHRFFRRDRVRHPFRLSRLHAPLRQKLPGDLHRVRRRDRALDACEPAEDPGRGDRAFGDGRQRSAAAVASDRRQRSAC